MRVDIWSDIRCPFCYIGKRNFENALENFEHSKKVDVVWHSFQLDPTLKTQPETSTVDYFTKVKGVTREQALQMFAGARKMAAEVGLELNSETSVVANSFQAHQLLQFAKTKGLDNEVKELLFEAQFANSDNIDDRETLLKVAADAGLDAKETETALSSGKYADNVKQDEMAAQKIGVRGVPFFVFNSKYAVSGAQPKESFLEVLEKVWEEAKQEEGPVILNEGDSCGIDGCD